jgi:hypothetical protein
LLLSVAAIRPKHFIDALVPRGISRLHQSFVPALNKRLDDGVVDDLGLAG